MYNIYMFQWINEHLGSLFQISLYILVFLVVLGYIYAQGKKETIINNWSNYRFKAYILPISGFINPIEGKGAIQSTLDNFAEFLWASFRSFFNILIKPVQYMLKIISSLAGNLEDFINNMRGQLTVMRNLILGIIMNMMKRIENIISASVFTFGKINEMMKRQLGIYQNVIYMLQTMTITMRSFVVGSFDNMMNFTEGAMWALPIFTLGAPGVVFPLMAFCFAEGTPILLKNGLSEKIENIKVGDIIYDNAQVISKMKSYYKGHIYHYNGTFITGQHYAFYNNNWTKIKDIPGTTIYDYDGYIYNLNTSSNLIHSNNNIFLDYDEYNTIDLAENENQLFLNKLNGYSELSYQPMSKDRRYKLGFTDATCLNGRPIGTINIGEILEDGAIVIGIVSHLLDYDKDRIYYLEGVGMTEWVKVWYGNKWINSRDHPDAKLIDYKGQYLYSIITSNQCIPFNQNLITRDFLEANLD